MKNVISAALVIALCAVSLAADDSDFRYSDSLARAFAPEGTVTLNLSAGEYRIRPGDNDRLRLIWHTRTSDQLADVRVSASVRGSEAVVRTSGPRSSFRMEIELPGRSDLELRMTAGDLSIAGIEGNKNVQLRAGNLHIEVADAAEYGSVQASVTAGDLSARPFGVNTGGLFRSFTHEGRGRYDLRARLWAGDLRLVSAVESRPNR